MAIDEDTPDLKLHTDVAEMKGMLNIALANHSLQLGDHAKAIDSLGTALSTLGNTVTSHGEKLNSLGEKVTYIDSKLNSQFAKVMSILTPFIAGAALLVTIVFDVLYLTK